MTDRTDPDRGDPDPHDTMPLGAIRQKVPDEESAPPTQRGFERASRPATAKRPTDRGANDSLGDSNLPASVTRATARDQASTRRATRPGATSPRREERPTVDPLSDTLEAAKSFTSEVVARSSEQLDEHAADPLVGLVVADRYRIVERIGRGGMGIVYRVEHTRIGKLLAMKLLAGELSSNRDVVRRFKQEAMTVSKLSSPYTVQVFDYGVWQHLTFLVMELVDGLDFGRALRHHGPLPFGRVGKLMTQVCASLAEAHQKGIVHRDIKPENIMIVADERGVETAKVLDFGLAKLRESSELNEVTLQGAVVGTPYYMAPEQVLGEDVDGRTDIYSLGAVMYRTLTGHYPFTATTPMAMFTKHLTEPAPAIAERHLELNVPKAVSDAVLRCMAKSKADRFQSIAELSDALGLAIRSLGLPSGDSLPLAAPGSHLDDDEEAPRRKRRGHDLGSSQIATREELEAYEATLRRNKYGAWAVVTLLGVAAAAAAGWFSLRPREVFRGEEREPNDAAGSANELPLGQSVRGHLGRRIDQNVGDQDMYRFTVPGSTAQQIAVKLTPLPNFGVCAALYRVGYQQSLAQYCSGAIGQQPVTVPAIRLEAGSYFMVVVQDLSVAPGSKMVTPIYENVSDAYTLTVATTTAEGADVEPNDTLEGAQPMAPGQEITGTLGFSNDKDVLCAATPGSVTFTVQDGKRRDGTVLEVTPLAGATLGPVMRVHHVLAQPQNRARFDADVNGPWTTPACRHARCCVQLRLARDPWIDPDLASGPLPDETHYRIKLEPRD